MRFAESVNPENEGERADAPRWQAMWETFHLVLETPAGERESRLCAQCGSDVALRAAVEELLRAHEALGDFLETSSHLPPEHPPVPLVLAPGTDLGRFVIRRFIGAGGMGVVYEATQKRPHRQVALKLIRTTLGGADLARRVEREADMLARLDHPGIGAVFDAGLLPIDGDAGVPFIAMELVDGPPLLDDAEQRYLSTAQRIELLASVADAVFHANQRGVLHCDLKPSNIRVTGDGRPKVLDFGVARIIDEDSLAVTLTRSHAALDGTLPYMSPERFDNDPRQLTALIDVYALGVVGYQLMSGRSPFGDCAGVFSLINKIRKGDTVPLKRAAPTLGRDVVDVIECAMDPSAADRYESAGDFAADLRRIVTNEPVQKPPRGRAYRLRRFIRRNRTGMTVAAVILVSLIAATGVSVREAVRATRAEQRSQRNAQTLWRLAKSILNELHDGIASLPGSTPVRRRLVETAQQYLEQIRVDEGDDPTFLLDLALAYERLGDVMGNSQLPNLGDNDGARANYDAALAIAVPLHRRFPNDMTITHCLGRMYVRRAEAAGPGEGAGAEPGLITQLGQGIELLRVAVDALGKPSAQLDLSHALFMDAWERAEEGDMTALAIGGAEALRLAELATQATPDDLQSQLDLAVAREWYGNILLQQNQSSTARTLIASAHAVLSRLTDSHPSNQQYAIEYARSLAYFGTAEAAVGNTDVGLELLEQSRLLSLQLFAANPDDQRFCRLHEITTTRLARTHAELGQDVKLSIDSRREHWSEAARFYRAGLAILNERIERGWMRHWEEHYPEEFQSLLERCEKELNALE